MTIGPGGGARGRRGAGIRRGSVVRRRRGDQRSLRRDVDRRCDDRRGHRDVGGQVPPSTRGQIRCRAGAVPEPGLGLVPGREPRLARQGRPRHRYTRRHRPGSPSGLDYHADATVHSSPRGAWLVGA